MTHLLTRHTVLARQIYKPGFPNASPHIKRHLHVPVVTRFPPI